MWLARSYLSPFSFGLQYQGLWLIICALIRKGHYSRALEEAVQAHKSQWAGKWEGKNPLHGGGNFNNMTPEQRVRLRPRS